MSEQLINICKTELHRYRLKDLEKHGFRRTLTKYCFTATYPPLKAMDALNEQQLFLSPPPKKNEYNLYFHFPFCTGKCLFCHFNPHPYNNQKIINKYLEIIQKEFILITDKINKPQINSIYFGGGSPSLIPLNILKNIVNLIKSRTKLSEKALVTLEVHPEIIIKYQLKHYFKNLLSIGINQISVGIQDFNNKVLKLVNRRHTIEEAIRVVKVCQDNELHVNIDLLHPLPGQNLHNWQYTLHQAFQLKPDSITLYTTAIRQNMPLYYLYNHQKSLFPSYQDSLVMYLMAEKIAKIYNYQESPVGWFIKNPSFHQSSFILSRLKKIIRPIFFSLSNHRQTKTNNGLIGIGASSYSFINNFQYYNIPTLNEYIDAVNNQRLPVWRGIHLNLKEQFYRAFIFNLKNGIINCQELQKDYGFNAFIIFKHKILLLTQLGLAFIDHQKIILTPKGYLFNDEVTKFFISPRINKKIQKPLPIDKEGMLIKTYNYFYEN